MKAMLLTTFVLSGFSLAMAEKPYFQQQANYKIRVSLNTEKARLDGSETVFYFNNSLDTLREAYFHLYYNAFQPGSYLDKHQQSEYDYGLSALSPERRGYARINNISNDGIRIDSFHIDNTIMRLPLASPLFPGDSTYFYIEFESQIPASGNRSAHDKNRFEAGQWFPKLALYDRYGWHANQYLSNSEFFSDYGNYDIELTLPSDYILAHPGNLLNETEIYGRELPLPTGDSILIDALKYMRKDTALESSATSAALDDSIPVAGGNAPDTAAQKPTKIWKIVAENVHDFAFCASPEYMVDICRQGDVIIKVYYTQSNQDRWRKHGADYTRQAIKLFSEIYYPYPYKNFSTVATLVTGGMEYPGLIMISEKYGKDNKYSHALESTIAHEAGHNWFYGILAFDETEEAFLDEGLAALATIRYLENYYGPTQNNFSYTKNWQERLLPNGNERNDCQKVYIRRALRGAEDPAATPANLFFESGRYFNASYDKAASIYFMLEYTLGHEKFEKFMRELFSRWAFRHPYLSDVGALAEEIYGDDLRWFFRQWFNTTWTLDYSLESFREHKADSTPEKYQADIRVERYGRCISPLDLVIYLKNGLSDTAYIPVSAWTDGQNYFDTSLILPAKPLEAAINPGLALADINRLNNSTGLPPVKFQFMVPRFIYPANYIEHFHDSYTVAHYPTLWYNSISGLKIGYNLNGSYLDSEKFLSFEFAMGLKNQKLDYSLKYQNPWNSLNPGASYFVSSREWEGRGRQELGLRYAPEYAEEINATQATIAVARNYVFKAYELDSDWSPGQVNTVDFNLSRKLSQHYSTVFIQAALSLSAPGSDYDFSRVAAGLAIVVPGFGAGKTHVYFKAGKADGNLPRQRRFRLSSADPYDIWDSPLYRSRGTLPDKPNKEGFLLKPGGAGLAGYYSMAMSGARLLSGKISNDLPAVNLPVEIPILSDELQRIAWNIYFGGGYVWDNKMSHVFDDFVWEGGLEVNYRIPGLHLIISESKLTVFLPLWLSKPPSGESNIKWRWLIGLTP